MAQLDLENHALVGPGGCLIVSQDDEITRKLLMLIEGECEGGGPLEAARKFGYCKQRYFQLRTAFQQHGAIALQSQKRGPKTNYRRTPEVVRQVIRHRFLDPDASPEVIAQKLCQSGSSISIRSVERVIAEYGLQKKTPQVRPGPATPADRDADHARRRASRRQPAAKSPTRRATKTRRQDQ